MPDQRENAKTRRRRRRSAATALEKEILRKYRQVRLLQGGDERPQRIQPSLRRELELVSGVDLEQVRVHTGELANRLADSLGARALAIGERDIYFAAGEFKPSTPQGKALLAHEITHLAQGSAGLRRRFSEPERHEMEMQARAVEEMVLARDEQWKHPGPSEKDTTEPAQVELPPDSEPENQGRPVLVEFDKAELEDKVYDIIQRQTKRELERTGRL